MRKKNPFGKSQSHDKPYAIYKNNYGWEWRVLKTYQHPDNEKNNPMYKINVALGFRPVPFSLDYLKEI